MSDFFAPGKMTKGFLCIFTLDRIDELRRFLKSYQKFNDLPISILLAKDTADAHRLKTLCAFYSPYDFTCMLDIDIMVNANLRGIFALVPDGKIGIVREKGMPVLNSGVLVFNTDSMKKLCEIWNKNYERKLIRGFSGKQGTWDQDLLIPLLFKNLYIELPFTWNCIVKDRSPEEELKIYNQVKIFHFLHAPDIDRTKYKSYQEFIKL